ncbi:MULTISPECIES: LPS export ABC transporter ATP-binding protein [Limnochorda]|uniref:LPS export ABC transporter ATP-binding protein n=1 Tax=Limnochorda TaxID=1676651 RepID=UPI0017F3EEDA|nr:LPS export ABC transporter ATP-binding protein [Limnochorda pilosa]MBO2485752.1 LPS export ABC transporter ATP-binding protein [Bacillota bacterium]MBO2519309.1 LPS export ABC transporter ATP-binding protein [Bacillota bacterium]NMA70554.1 LPS export ABC transporter ATP-binding protein [Bacillota bacterium]
MSLQAQGLVKGYRGRVVVRSVSLEVGPGEVVGLLGPNGAGKTTTFYMILGLVRPDAGTVFLDGRDISRVPVYQRARLGLGYLAQEPSIFRRLTVEENLRLILERLPLSREEQEARVEQLLEEFDLVALRRQPAALLSGGERRRCEVARAVAGEPRYLLLDEPFAGVDPIAVAELQELIRSLTQRGIGVLITDHNVRETLTITHRAYIMHQGHVLVAGTAEELLESPEARRFYLGERFRL